MKGKNMEKSDEKKGHADEIYEQVMTHERRQGHSLQKEDRDHKHVQAMTEPHGEQKESQEEQQQHTETNDTNNEGPYDDEDVLIRAIEEDAEKNSMEYPESSLVFENRSTGSEASRVEEGYHGGERPSTKELTDHCRLNEEVTIYSPYWNKHGGGYLSHDKTVWWNHGGEKWKLKASKANGRINIWGDFWNQHWGKPFKTRGGVARFDGLGEQWKVYESKTKGSGRVAFYSQYWFDHNRKGWMSRSGQTHWYAIGEEWYVRTKNGKDACPAKGLIDSLVWKWHPVRLYDHQVEVCMTQGISTDLTKQQTTTFSKSVTKVLEHKVEVSAEVEGVGGATQSLTARRELTSAWSKSYSESFSKKTWREEKTCVKVRDKNSPSFMWQWGARADFLVRGNTNFLTATVVFTKGRDIPPKCIPGYGADYSHQKCRANGYLPGFSAERKGPCKNNHRYCRWWRRYCHHGRYTSWMRQNCAKTCGSCR